jgi:hypothetical protein
MSWSEFRSLVDAAAREFARRVVDADPGGRTRRTSGDGLMGDAGSILGVCGPWGELWPGCGVNDGEAEAEVGVTGGGPIADVSNGLMVTGKEPARIEFSGEECDGAIGKPSLSRSANSRVCKALTVDVGTEKSRA